MTEPTDAERILDLIMEGVVGHSLDVGRAVEGTRKVIAWLLAMDRERIAELEAHIRENDEPLASITGREENAVRDALGTPQRFTPEGHRGSEAYVSYSNAHDALLHAYGVIRGMRERAAEEEK